jgi:hypothetical protein
MRTEAIVIGIVMLILVSGIAFGTFSYAVRTGSSTGTQHTTNRTASSSPSFTPHSNTTKTVPSQITTKNPVAHNATTLTSGNGACSATDNYLWNHVYGKTDHSSPPNHRFHDYGQCITVIGKVYSSAGTTQEPDGDLHFTLHLIDSKDFKYSNQYDPQGCLFKNETKTNCHNIIVEVICHNTVDQSYIKQFNNYCKDVNSVFKGIPAQYDKLSVSGRWVQDIDETTPTAQRHAPWNEIHPASYVHHIA